MPVKLPFWGTLLTLIGLSILIALGSWQLHRLQWKENLLAQLDKAYEAPAASITPDQLTPDLNLTRGALNGRFTPDQITISARTHDGAPGYHLIAPLKLSDGSYILVNRGWIPLNYEIKAPPKGALTVAGLLRTPEKPNIFVPKNTPEKDQWYRIDIEQIAQHFGLESAAPLILYAETSKAEYPIAVGTKPSPNNNHLQYAFFWFAMAAAMALVYILKFIVKK